MKKLVLLAIGAVIVGCSSPTAQSGSLEVELDEFYIEPESHVVKAGSIDLELWNDGEIPHTLVVASDEGVVLAASDTVDPAARQSLTVRLDPGTYQLTCRIVFRGDDGVLVDHYQEGMGTVLTVEP